MRDALTAADSTPNEKYTVTTLLFILDNNNNDFTIQVSGYPQYIATVWFKTFED